MGFRRLGFYRQALGMAQVYTVTGSTSVVLISSLQAPNTVVLLSSMQYPGHIVTIRDITGSNSIAETPIIISTISSLKFYDGTSSILLNTPNGFLSLSSRDRSTWQLLNSVGFLTTLSTGFLETLTTQNVFVGVTSSIEAFASSMVVTNVTISKSFEALGNTDIGGNIQIGGSFNVFSTLRAFQSMNLSSGLEVGGDVSFASTLSIRDSLTVGSNLSTFQNATIRDNLLIDTNFSGNDVLRPIAMPFLSVQILRLSTMNIGGGGQLFGGVSTKALSSLSSLFVEGKGTFKGDVTVRASTSVASSFSLEKNMFVNLSFTSLSSLAVYETTQATDFLGINGGVSTLEFVSGSKVSQLKEVDLFGPLFVSSHTSTQSLVVYGSSIVSSVATRTLQVTGYVSSQLSTFETLGELKIGSTFTIGGDLIASVTGFRAEPFPTVNAQFLGDSYVSSLNVLSTMTIGGILNVSSSALVTGYITGINTLQVNGTFSTVTLQSFDSLFVTQILSVGGTAFVSTLQAPIELEISTLSLSNVLEVGSNANFSSLQLSEYPTNMAAGSTLTNIGSYNLFIDGILQNTSTVLQTNTYSPLKVWTANHLQTSSLFGLPNLSTTYIGNADFSYPIADTPYRGIVLGGFPLTGKSVYWASNVSSTYRPCEGVTLNTFVPNRIRYNGSNRWVAVGSNSAGTSFLYSDNGYDWNAGTGVSMVNVTDVAYGGDKWVAVGSNNTPGPSTIAYSLDGIDWNQGTNGFGAGDFGSGVAYNGTVWAAVGRSTIDLGYTQLVNALAKYSADGITWIDAITNQAFGPGWYLKAVVWADDRWIATTDAYASPSFGFQPVTWRYTSINTSNWFSGSGFQGLSMNYLSYDPIRDYILTVGNAISGNAAGAILFTDNQLNVPTQVGGGFFYGAATDCFYDSNTTSWIVTGHGSYFASNSPSLLVANTTDLLFYASAAWVPNCNAFPGSTLTVAAGNILAPDLAPYFTPNVTTIFHSTLSSQEITASTVQASSIEGFFFGDGSLLTGITRFSDTLGTSSLKVFDMISTNNISTMLMKMKGKAEAKDSVLVEQKPFFCTFIQYVTVGNDYISQGSIQTSPDGVDWTRALTANFEYYGNGIVGNNNTNDPFFVAVGADSRSNYTIQWSRDALVWSPVESGGFSNPSAEGICEGTGVAYNGANNPSWVAVGKDPLGSNTIQFSYDGIYWEDALGGFEEFGIMVKTQPANYQAAAFLATGKNGARYTFNGILWIPCFFENSYGPPITPTLVAVAAGDYQPFSNPPVTTTGWLGVDEERRVWVTAGEIPNGFYYYGDYPYVNPGDFITVTPVNDLIWIGDTDWVAVGSNKIQFASNAYEWSVTCNLPVEEIYTIYYKSTISKYFLGASASNPPDTIWTSSNASNWTSLALSNEGFSSFVENLGQGFGIVSLGFSTFAVGQAAFTPETILRPSILGFLNSSTTQVSLTANNASNVFDTQVRGIGGSENEIYKYIAVGDGLTPQKTIARSQDGSPNSWIPAITGGFSTTGYAVVYSGNKWIAVGDAQSSSNVIQYSPDGANWFGTNNAAALRSGGRALAVGSNGFLVAGGKDTGNKTFAYSSDGFTWTPGTGSYFERGANGIGFNSTTGTYIAVGDDLRGSNYTILRSTDGQSWTNFVGGSDNFFSSVGYGVVYGNPNGSTIWVAVGDDPNPNNTILYSSNDGSNWTSITSNGFTIGGYGVTYNSSISTFFAVGKDTNGNAFNTIKSSENGIDWVNISTGGFLSQKSFGAAYGFFVQGIATTELIPYMDFTKLAVYNKTVPLLYPKGSIRASTSYIAFSESLFINLSSQVSIGSNTQYGTAAVTVSPYTTFTSSLIYTGQPYLSSASFFSSVIVSSLITGDQISSVPYFLNPVETPFLAINGPLDINSNDNVYFRIETGRANVISPSFDLSGGLQYRLNINDALHVGNFFGNNIYTGQEMNIGYVTIGSSFSQYTGPDLNVIGEFTTSTLLAPLSLGVDNIYISAPRVFYKDDFMSMFSGSNPLLDLSANTLYTTQSSLTFNSLLTLQVSTQKVGVYTRNPQFELDVQGTGVLSTVSTNTLNTRLFYLNLQTLNVQF